MAEILERHTTFHPQRLATSDLANNVADEEVVFCTTCALEHFVTRERWRGFALFTIFYILYMVYTHLLIDWAYAGVTRSIVDDVTSGFQQADQDIYCDTETRVSAVNNKTCWWDFKDLTSVHEILQYVLYQVNVFGSNLHEVCERCKAALTLTSENIERLSGTDFACTDFSSDPDTGSYPDRDCAVEDAIWSASPNAVGAPCCQNATLMVASFLMVAMEDVLGRSEASLDELMDTLTSKTGTEILTTFLQKHISSNNHIFQVIISREQRMLGINFVAAHHNEGWVKDDVVRASNNVWSKRFDILAELRWLRLAYLLFSALSLMDDMITVWSCTVTEKQLVEEAMNPWNYFVIVTAVIIWTVEVGQSRWDMGTWTMLVAACQMMMLCRLFVEGEVLMPFKLIFRTVTIATKQLSILVTAVVIWMAVMAGIYGMLFGTFSYTEDGYGSAFLDIFNQFGTGASTSSSADAFNKLASKITFVITMLTLYLTLSQVFITILMDSYEQSRADIAQQPPSEMPAGFEPTPWVPHPWESLWNLAVAGTTYYLPYHKAFTPQIVRFLTLIRLDAIRANPDVLYVPPFATRAELEAVRKKHPLNKIALERLLRKFGARKIRQQADDPLVTSAVSALSTKDRIADLRAQVFALARSKGEDMPYRDLTKMSRQSLLLLLDSLNDNNGAAIPQDQTPDSTTALVE